MIPLRAIAVALALPAASDASPARDWIDAAQGGAARWQELGTLELPSGRIFIGDPSWGDAYHMKGARPVEADELDVWLRVGEAGGITAVWLEASGETPVRISAALPFGMEAAYFALGDKDTGSAIAALGEADLPDIPDGFALFRPVVQEAGFVADWVPVPPRKLPALAIGTGSDGGLHAVWTRDTAGKLSGILIDVTGRDSDGRFIDLLLEEG